MILILLFMVIQTAEKVLVQLYIETYQVVVERNYRYNRYMYNIKQTQYQMGTQLKCIPSPKYFKQRSRAFKFPKQEKYVFFLYFVMKLSLFASAAWSRRAVLISDAYK